MKELNIQDQNHINAQTVKDIVRDVIDKFIFILSELAIESLK